MPVQVNYAAGLPFGHGKIGALNQLVLPEERIEFASALSVCTLPITDPTTGDCVDGRGTIAFANGVNDPAVLANRVVAQYPGGLYLAVTKAAVAADLAILRDSKNITGAYLAITEVMDKLGYHDGGHANCGASTLVQESVASEISDESIDMTLPVLVTNVQNARLYVRLNKNIKQKRLNDGYYGTWSHTWHEGHLYDTVPQNFATLEVDPDDHEFHGHKERAAYSISTPDYGFAKNKFIAMTGGQQSFAVTTRSADTMIERIISQIVGSPEERSRLRLELGIDTAQVLNELVLKGLPVFTEAA